MLPPDIVPGTLQHNVFYAIGITYPTSLSITVSTNINFISRSLAMEAELS